MADNTLMWERLDKNETIEELIRKINNNFSQFAMHNGGSPGQAGKDGFSASVLMNRCSVHSVTQDDIVRRVNELGNSSVDDITFEEYLGGKKVPDVIIGDYFDGDIIYFKNKIYEYSKNTTPDYKLIHSISGEKGDKGDTGSGISKFVHSTEYPGISDYVFDDYLFFNDLGNNNKPSHMIMMNAADYVGNEYRPGTEDAVESNSLIMVKENESTGIGFLKLNGNELTYQGKIQLDGNNNLLIHNNNELHIDSVDELTITCNTHESYTSNGYIYMTSDEIRIGASSVYIHDVAFGNNYIDIDSDNINIGQVKFYGGDPDDENNVNIHRINLEGIKNIDINQSNGLSIGKINIKDSISNGNLIQTTLQSKGKLEISTENTGDILITTNCYGNIELCSEDKFTLNFNDENEFELTNNGNTLELNGSLDLGSNTLTSGNIASTKLYSDTIESQRIKSNGDFFINSEVISDVLNAFTSSSVFSNCFELSNIINTLSIRISQLENTQPSQESQSRDLLPIGSIIMSAIKDSSYNTLKSLGYVFCDGRTLSSIFGTSSNAEAKASDIYKALRGATIRSDWQTVKIPDLTNKFPRGKGLASSELSSGGKDSVTLDIKNLPPHNHKYAGNEDMWGSNPYSPFRVEPRVGVRKSGGDSSSGYLYYTQKEGSGIPFDIIPSYADVYFYIKVSNDPIGTPDNTSSGSGSSSGSESGSSSGSGSSQVEQGENWIMNITGSLSYNAGGVGVNKKESGEYVSEYKVCAYIYVNNNDTSGYNENFNKTLIDGIAWQPHQNPNTVQLKYLTYENNAYRTHSVDIIISGVKYNTTDMIIYILDKDNLLHKCTVNINIAN